MPEVLCYVPQCKQHFSSF